MEDLYLTLGVPRAATTDEIGKAYRRLARKHHPDLNPGDAEAEVRFRQIAAAYEVLSDADKRKAYDEFGEDSLNSGFDPDKARAYQQWHSRRTASGQPFASESFEFDLDGLFGAPRGYGSAKRPSKGSDLFAVVELELAQAIEGAQVILELPNTEPCASCRGSGHASNGPARACSGCHGTGKQQVAEGPLRMVATCPACGGSGEVVERCTSCSGHGVCPTRNQVTVRIPPGADNGSTLRLSGKGAPGSLGGQPGDLVIETKVSAHPWLRREGLDLFLKLPVSLDECYNGAQIEVPTFGGRVKLRIPPKSQPGSRLRLRGKGVTRGKHRGDLYVELDLRMPLGDDQQLSDAIRKSDSGGAQSLRAEVRL